VCAEEIRLWKGPKPIIPRGVTPKYETKKKVLNAFLDGPLSVRECSEIAGITDRAARACIRRCLNARHRHLEKNDQIYDPKADRIVERFALTDIGRAWVCYWLGYDPAEFPIDVVAGGPEVDESQSQIEEVAQPQPERPVYPEQRPRYRGQDLLDLPQWPPKPVIP
jgi:hypothetical protein